LLGQIQAQTQRLAGQHAVANALFHNSPALIIGLNKEGHIIQLNSYAQQVTGYTETEALGKSFFELLVPMRYRRLYGSSQEFADNYFAASPGPESECYLLCKDGSERLIQWGGSRVSDDVVATVAIGQDVTVLRAAEADMRQQAALLKLFLDNMPIPIIVKDRDHRFIVVSQAKADHWQTTVEDMIGNTDYDFFPEAEADVAWADEEQVMKTGEPIIGKTERITYPDGSEHWYSVTKAPYSDDDGQIIGVLGISHDITARKQAEDELRQSEEKYRSLTEHLPDVIVQISPEGVMQYLSPAITQLAGYEPEEGLGQPVINFIAEADRSRIMEAIDEARQTGQTHTVEFTLVAKTGEEIPVEISSFPLTEDNKLVALQCVMRDITERKQAQEMLEAERERLEVTLRSIGEAVIVADSDGRVALINDVAEELTGWPNGEALGQSVSEIFTIVNQHTREPVADPVENVLTTGGLGCLANDTILISRDGTERIIADSGAPIHTDGEVIGVILVFRDVTERIKLEEHLRENQRLEALGTLASGIAHDFNNVLQAIVSWVALIQLSEDLDEELQEAVHEVQGACERGGSLVRQVQAFAAPSELHLGTIDITEVVDNACGILQPGLSKLVTIQSQIVNDELWYVQGDAHLLEQVIVNLCTNSAEAMSDGGAITITLENLPVDEDYLAHHPMFGLTAGPYVRLSVSDTGPGIDAETLEHIFEPFYSTKQRSMHSGLGLAMVYGIVHQHQGDILASSKPGEGTTFQIYLSAVSPEDEPGEVAEAPELDMPATVLLVDDEAPNIRSGQRLLEHLGYEVFTASSGKEAVELFQDHHEQIDLVMLDLIMPQMSGEQCLDELLQIDPDVTVVIVSGYIVDKQTHLQLEPLVAGFLNKPITVERLLESIRGALGGD